MENFVKHVKHFPEMSQEYPDRIHLESWSNPRCFFTVLPGYTMWRIGHESGQIRV